jgi:hypothetical protein
LTTEEGDEEEGDGAGAGGGGGGEAENDDVFPDEQFQFETCEEDFLVDWFGE